MSEEASCSGFGTLGCREQLGQPLPQHPLASLATSVQGIHKAFAGQPSRPRPQMLSQTQSADSALQRCRQTSQCSGSDRSSFEPSDRAPSGAARAAGLVFASVPGTSNIFASAEEQPLLLLSDTVWHLTGAQESPKTEVTANSSRFEN